MTKLEFALKEKQIKPVDVARQLNMHPSKLHYVMNGYQKIAPECKLRLAEISGIDPDELFEQVRVAAA